MSAIRRYCLLMAITVLAVLVGTGFATAAEPRIPPPTCGDHFSIQDVSFDYQSQTVEFRVVGVDLSAFLGYGYGVMDVSIHDALGFHHAGYYNASGTSGARSELLAAAYPTFGGSPVSVMVDLEFDPGDYPLCRSYYGVPGTYSPVALAIEQHVWEGRLALVE